MDVQYRPARVDDLPQIRRLLEAVMGDMRDLRHDQFTVASSQGRVVGCVRIKELEGGHRELASLAVESDLRGNGIGSALVTLSISRETVRPIYLLCLEETATFYTKLGFLTSDIDELPPPLKEEYLHINCKLADLQRSIVAMMTGGHLLAAMSTEPGEK